MQLASHAVERLHWSAFPALETVRLQVSLALEQSLGWVQGKPKCTL